MKKYSLADVGRYGINPIPMQEGLFLANFIEAECEKRITEPNQARVNAYFEGIFNTVWRARSRP